MRNTKDLTTELQRAIARAEHDGITRYWIAKVAKMPQSQVARIARGESIPRLDTAQRIAKALGYRLALVPIVAKKVVHA